MSGNRMCGDMAIPKMKAANKQCSRSQELIEVYSECPNAMALD